MANEFEPQKDDLQKSGKDGQALGYGGTSRRVLRGFIVIAGVVGVSAFGLYAYNKGKEDGRTNIPPIIKPKDGPTKVRPEHPGGMKVPNRDKEVFDRFNEKTPRPKVEIILTAPEAPLKPIHSKKKKPSQKAKNGPNKSSMIEKPQNPLIKNESGIKPAATGTASKKPTGIKKNETKIRVGQKLFIGTKNYKIQLASLRSEAAVKNAWRLIIKNNSDLVGKLGLNIERKDFGGSRGAYYRMQAGPIGTRMEAQALCTKLKTRRVRCIVVGG